MISHDLHPKTIDAPAIYGGEVYVEDQGTRFLQAISLGGHLYNIYSRRIHPSARRGINFADMYAAYNKASDVTHQFADFIFEASNIYHEYSASKEDMAQDLSLRSLSENPDHAFVGKQLLDHAIQQNYTENDILDISTEQPVVFLANNIHLIEYQKFVNQITAILASNDVRQTSDASNDIRQSNATAAIYFELLGLIDRYTRAHRQEDTAEAKKMGQAINQRIKKLLEESLRHKIGFDALLNSSGLNAAKNEELTNRIIGVTQEINGVNLFHTVGAFVKNGSAQDDLEGKDTLHTFVIDGDTLPTAIDWKASVSSVMEDKNGHANHPISAVLKAGDANYMLDIACTERTNDSLKFVACLSKYINGKRIPINRIQLFNLSAAEAAKLRANINDATMHAILAVS